MLIPKEDLLDVLRKAPAPEEAILEIYNLVHPSFFEGPEKKMTEYPQISPDAWKIVCRTFIDAWGQSGGLTWMNWGFASGEILDHPESLETFYIVPGIWEYPSPPQKEATS